MKIRQKKLLSETNKEEFIYNILILNIQKSFNMCMADK